MTDEEAALLAELRAISNSSASATRFDNDDGENNDGNNNDFNKVDVPKPSQTPKKAISSPAKTDSPMKSPGNSDNIPPWKRKGNKTTPLKKFMDEQNASNDESSSLPPWKRKNNSATKNKSVDPFENIEIMAPPEPPSINRNEVVENSKPRSNNNIETTVKKVPSQSISSPPVNKITKSPNNVSSNAAGNNISSSSRNDNQPIEQSQSIVGGFSKSNNDPKSFKGEFGGSAEDAELLAELRAISMKSSSANRFADDADDDGNNQMNNFVEASKPKPVVQTKKVSSPVKQSPINKRNEDSLPPWKRGNKAGATSKNANPFDNIEIAVPKGSTTTTSKASPKQSKVSDEKPLAIDQPIIEQSQSIVGGFSKSNNDPKSFKGEFGGSAEDAELLAELRAISMKSSSANRFADGGDDVVVDDNNQMNNFVEASKPKPVVKQSPVNKRDDGKVPPWKKNSPSQVSKQNQNEDSLPPWKRGNKSGASQNANPFDNIEIAVPKGSTTPSKASPEKSKAESETKPESQEQVDISPQKNSTPNRFMSWMRKSGPSSPDNKGSPDAKSTPASSPPKSTAEIKVSSPKSPTTKSPQEKAQQSPSFFKPWKRAAKNEENASQPTLGGFATNNTFQGERGGAAEDAALLAELRAISLQSSSSNRFGDDNDNESNNNIEKAKSIPAKKPMQNDRGSNVMNGNKDKVKSRDPFENSGGIGSPSTPIKISTNSFPKSPTSPTVVDPGNEEIIVTVETVRDALGSKNWKFRKAAYELLARLVIDEANGREASNEVTSDDVLKSLDNLVPEMMKDSNAGALDSALRFALLYVDHCSGASKTSQAKDISANLTAGPAMASTRPSTAKLVKELYLKLMEVGNEGVSSVHAVVDSLLTLGLTSKKPKVVVNSVQFVLDAAHSFGAASLPLAKITSCASQMLEHQNRDVREAGINILAEICRVVGSKDPLEDIIGSMRSSQVAELDDLLSKQADPVPPTSNLRYQKLSSSSNDALAVLQAGAEEAAAEAFASREAVDIFVELKETEYTAKMKEAKWSEKVAALDILLSCGGKKPYKLVQPSSTANYGHLISDLKRLLEHTHFAVKSKSMKSLAMLAEGVGEALFPYLRPLLLPIILLSKDKKLTTATNECLDSLFGNILSFDHLMESEGGLPAVMDEKEQKNGIIRSSALAYLNRSVSRQEQAGPRGSLKTGTVSEIVNLCTSKTTDSDVTVRNEAVSILNALVNHEDNRISQTAKRLTKELENDNPRLYKMLQSNNTQNTHSNDISSGVRETIPKSRSNSTGRNPRRPSSSIPKGPTSPTKKAPRSSSVKRVTPQKKATKNLPTSSGFVVPKDENVVDPEDALMYLSTLDIPNWSGADDEGGVLLGLKSSNWKFRKEAIDTLSEFSRTDTAKSEASKYPESVFVAVKEYTKDFRDSNFNIMKAVIELMLNTFDLYELMDNPLDIWITRSATAISVEKISDKKFASLAPPLLVRLCELQIPEIVIVMAIDALKPIKSPLQHEGMLAWMTDFCKDFGASSLGKSIPTILEWILMVST